MGPHSCLTPLSDDYSIKMLAVIETHPVQYHAPVYRVLQNTFKIPVTAIYGSDFSIAGYRDPEFQETFAWDTDLLSGYRSVFLSHVSRGGGKTMTEVSVQGMGEKLQELNPRAALLLGYTPYFYQKSFYHLWRSGCPILFRADTADHALKRGVIKNSIRDAMLRWIYKKCFRLLYIGQRSYEHFRRLGCPDEKLVFSPYCVDTAPFQCSEEDRKRLRSKSRDELGVEEQEIALLFSGKLSVRKGPDLLLEAVKNLPPRLRKEVVVLFMGEGELKRKLSDTAKKSPSSRTHFAGFQNQTELSPRYHAADLLIMPSRHSEVWGLVVNEALHHGLPCVVSEAVGCAPDLIEEGITGEIFATDSAKSLAEAIQRALPLVGNPAVRDKCREKVGDYTIQRAAEGISRAYRSIVDGGR